MTFKHNIVALDAWVEPPPFDFDYTLTVIRDNTAASNPDQLKDSTIWIDSQLPITRGLLEHAPKLQLIAVTGTGTNHVDHDAIRDRGITLCKVPAQNTDTVSEHAFTLYSALKRKILPMHALTIEGKKWPEMRTAAPAFGPPPRTNAEETLVRDDCIAGYGSLGRHVEKLGKALGMTVLIAERKGATEVREGRTAFETALSRATLFIVTAPLDSSTRDMFNTAELNAMDSTSIVVNVGRGGVINELALAEALRKGQIAGAATDVFETEPASKDTTPLLDPTIPNLILSPHVAWYSSKTIKGTIETVIKNVEGFVAGRPQNVVIAGPSARIDESTFDT